MKKLALVLSIAMLSSLGGSADAQERWCAQVYGEGGRENCHFTTLRQCQESVSGRGGFCRPSQYYVGSQRRGRSQTNGMGQGGY
jgi:hypothetical protein